MAVVGLNAIDMMFFIPAYPFWALVIIAVDVVALYGLCAYGSRQNLDAVERRSAGSAVTRTARRWRNRGARYGPGRGAIHPSPDPGRAFPVSAGISGAAVTPGLTPLSSPRCFAGPSPMS